MFPFLLSHTNNKPFRRKNKGKKLVRRKYLVENCERRNNNMCGIFQSQLFWREQQIQFRSALVREGRAMRLAKGDHFFTKEEEAGCETEKCTFEDDFSIKTS
jgi:hypothetical protein